MSADEDPPPTNAACAGMVVGLLLGVLAWCALIALLVAIVRHG